MNITATEWDDAENNTRVVSNRDAAIAVAKSLGKDEAVAVFESAAAVGVQGELSVILPPNRLESLSKGRGWARLGKFDDATWGVKCEGGYRVNRPGVWTVGGDDGFNRKREDMYKVSRVKIGDMFWVVAHNA